MTSGSSKDLSVSDASADPSNTPQVPVPRYDLRILKALRQIIRHTELHSKTLAAKYKITSPQLVCLMTLNDHGSMTSKALSEVMYLSPSTIVGILDRLEDKRLVLRTRSKKDRRNIDVTISDKGVELLENTPSPLQDKLYQAFQWLPEDEKTTIAHSLERIVELMEAEQTAAEPLLESGPITQSAEAKEIASKIDEMG